MKHLIPLVFIFIFISACKKSELEQVSPNTPPYDHTISTVTIENYITRTYILTLGREPDNAEFNAALSILLSAKLDSASRSNFLDNVFRSSDYLPNVYNANKLELLNNVDTADITNWIYIFQLFLTDSTYQLQWPYFQYEIDRLSQLQSAFGEFTDSIIPIDELQRRMCNNYLYDQINMGSANFVISTFQNLINRNPTIAEQSAGVSMVEGNNSVLFLQAGASKNDYLDIFTHSQNYFEGQVIFLYLKFLNRLPTSVEMADGAALYSSTGDYTSVQRIILSTDEFIGL